MNRYRSCVALIAGAAALAGCATTDDRIAAEKPSVIIEEQPEWRNVATAEDAARLDALGANWTATVAALPKKDRSDLLDPQTALAVPTPPPGRYKCRVVRVAPGGKRVTAFNPFTCHIGNDGPRLNFTKESGSERPAGWMWADGESRLIFLGTMIQGREKSAPAYGKEPRRNLAGVVERIGDFRWRMVLPTPIRDSRLDVIELTPLVEQS
jgi:hypothetical protein